MLFTGLLGDLTGLSLNHTSSVGLQGFEDRQNPSCGWNGPPSLPPQGANRTQTLLAILQEPNTRGSNERTDEAGPPNFPSSAVE